MSLIPILIHLVEVAQLFLTLTILYLFYIHLFPHSPQLAIEYGTKFFETSAKASINVEEAFFTLARDIKSKMEQKQVSIAVRFSLLTCY